MGTLDPTTPTRRRISVLNTETPHVRKQSNHVQSNNGNLAAVRNANVVDVGSAIPEVPYQFFADNILPLLPPNVDVPSVIQALKTSGDIDSSGRWRAFAVDPCQDARPEPTVFDSLYLVTSAIASHINPTAAGLAVTYESQPNHVLIPEFSKRESKPDGYFLLNKRFRQPLPEDVAKGGSDDAPTKRGNVSNGVAGDSHSGEGSVVDGVLEKDAVAEGHPQDACSISRDGSTKIPAARGDCEGNDDSEKAAIASGQGRSTNQATDKDSDKVDAKRAVERRYWRDICTPAEFKKMSDSDTLADDVNKICWAMYQVLHEDPRRRFTFAFTIENTDMRVWFASRSDMLVSEPFDFITDHEKVVHFFLSQLSADELSLGFDPTMQLVSAEKGKIPVYDIAVHESGNTISMYRTMGLINQDGAACIRGRATRVWDVAAIIDNTVDEKQTGVLKDSWVDSDRQREGAILQELQEAQAAINLPRFKELFLTVLAHGDVRVGNPCRENAHCSDAAVDEVSDDTRLVITRGAHPPSNSLFYLPRTSSQTSSAQSETTLPGTGDKTVPATDASSPIPNNDFLSYPQKTRYRIVFKQRCTPLSQETSLAAALCHISHSVRALRLMHHTTPGWVHRDISTGNILIDSDGNVRLADLEYSKRLNDDSTHDVRTGTLYYMAVEVERGRYEFRPTATEPPAAPPVALMNIDDIYSQGLVFERQAIPQTRRFLTFRHNALHDMESILWIILEFLLDRERSLIGGAGTADPRALTNILRTQEICKYSKILFSSVEERRDVIVQKSPVFDDILKRLSPPFSKIGESVGWLRDLLTAAYTEYETSGNLDPKAACPEALYTRFYIELQACASQLAEKGDVILQSQRTPAQGARKARGTGNAAKVSKTLTPLIGSEASASTRKRKSQNQGGSTGGKKKKSEP